MSFFQYVQNIYIVHCLTQKSPHRFLQGSSEQLGHAIVVKEIVFLTDSYFSDVKPHHPFFLLVYFLALVEQVMSKHVSVGTWVWHTAQRSFEYQIVIPPTDLKGASEKFVVCLFAECSVL